jgi:lambda repressor-like predicted transcriptional regulator
MSPNNIKVAMVRGGITQASIARQLGIKLPSVNGVVNGRCTNYRVMDLIAEKLGKNPRTFWGPRYRKVAKF